MKINKIKIGDTIQHYCFGELITGEVIEIGENRLKTRHPPIRWGNDIITETNIVESLYLQKEWGGTNKDGKPTKGPDTSPAAFFNGKPIEI